ncbi:alpha/beta hydrolase [Streptomonospora salina]|uniref:alpha/beta hydrolase n=1 Tax=Streptomonospora salina TaxID=104205 RepID=UPI00160C2CF0
MRAAAAALALAAAAAGCTGSGGDARPEASGSADAPDGAPARFYGQRIDWRDCGGDGAQCGTVAVPLDYGEPAGERLEIAVQRIPATGNDPAGSLVVNPGGPGGSGFEYAETAARRFGDSVRERFDIVGFDPRGVERSSPITCLGRSAMDDFIAVDFTGRDGASDPAAVSGEGLDELARLNRGFVDGCREHSGELVMHMGTEEVARDVDVLRSALGDDELTFLGKSYGTYLGAHYADMFPDRVRALVLDGAMDPSAGIVELGMRQAEGSEVALRSFIADCLEHADCPLGSEGDGVEPAVDKLSGLLDEAGREPLHSDLDDDRRAGRSWLELGIHSALYSESSWPKLRTALGEAFDGDGTRLLRMGGELYNRDDADAYTNYTSALVTVNCSDRQSPRDIDAFADAAERADATSPLFGASLTWGGMTCAYWPKEAVPEPEPLDAPGAPPILVVGTTRDSATPYEWAENLAAELESGVLLTRDGDGHTAYGRGSDCVDEAVDAYLLRTEPPEEGTVCS